MGQEKIAGLLKGLQRTEETLRELHAGAADLVRELTEERARLTTILEHMPSGVIVLDAQGRLILANPAAVQIGTGQAGGAALAIDPSQPILSQYDQFRLRDPVTGRPYRPDETATARVLAGESVAYQEVVIRPLGSREDVYLHVSGAPLRISENVSTGAVLVFTDITAQKRVERALKESEAKLRAIFDSAGLGIALLTVDGRFATVNRQFEQILGYAPQELDGVLIRAVTHPDDLTITRQVYAKLKGGAGVFQTDKRYIRKDGQVIWGRVTGTAIRDRAGEPEFIIGTVEDITAHKAAEQALRESEELYRAVVECSRDAIIIVAEGQYVFANQAFLDLVGAADPSQVVGQPNAIFIVPEERELVRQRARAREEGHQAPACYETQVQRLDGTTRAVEISATRVLYGNRPAALSFVRDVTERKQAEAAQRELAQLEGVTLSAREMAHRLNNDLAITVSAAELLQNTPDLPPEIQRLVAHALAGLERADHNLKQWLRVTRIKTKDSLLGPALDLERSVPQAADEAS